MRPAQVLRAIAVDAGPERPVDDASVSREMERMLLCGLALEDSGVPQNTPDTTADPPNGPEMHALIVNMRGNARQSWTEVQDTFCRVARTATINHLVEQLEGFTPSLCANVVQRHALNGTVGYQQWVKIVRELSAAFPALQNVLTAKLFSLIGVDGLYDPATAPKPAAPGAPVARADRYSEGDLSDSDNKHGVYHDVVALKPVVFDARLVTNILERVAFSLRAQTTITRYDCYGNGVILEPEIDELCHEVLSRHPRFAADKASLPFFAASASRALIYFLDPRHRGKVRIADLVRSPYLRQLDSLDDSMYTPELGEMYGPLGKGHRTWFSYTCMKDMYDAYTHAAQGHDGLLAEENLLAIPGLTLTPAFARQVFASVFLYPGDLLDYRGYLDMLLALTFPKNTACARYLFPVLDVGCKGFVTTEDLLYFMGDIMREVLRCCADDVVLRIEDFIMEVLETAKPRDPAGITLQDIYRSKGTEILVAYLVDPQFLIDKELAAQSGILRTKCAAWEP